MFNFVLKKKVLSGYLVMISPAMMVYHTIVECISFYYEILKFSLK